jgi:hypothetical protein
MGLDKTSKSPRKTRNKVIRISFASLKLPTLQFIKHILGPREPITESLRDRQLHRKVWAIALECPFAASKFVSKA